MERDHSIIEIGCPVDTYSRITIELASAVEKILNIAHSSKMEKGSYEHKRLMGVLEHVRIAKVMSERGDGFAKSVIDFLEQPEYDLDEELVSEGACSDEDEEDEE